jgi:polar amino acid transport system substrate-binding protein
MKRVSLLILTLIFLIFAEAKVLTSASDPWPPFIDPQSSSEGLSLEIVRAAFKTQGYTIKHSYIPWARAMKNLKEGKIDIIPNTWMTEERKQFLEYSNTYISNEIKFIKKAGDPFEFNGLSSLKGKKVGTVRGYGYGDEFSNSSDFKREDVSSIHQNIKKLILGRIDLTLEDEIVARVAIAQKDPQLLEAIAFTNNALSTNTMHITSGKANPNHKEYIDAFNKGLKIIKDNGEFSVILKKYGIELK